MELVASQREGSLIHIDEASISHFVEAADWLGGRSVEHVEFFWLATGIAAGKDIKLIEWLMSGRKSTLQVSRIEPQV
jgi:hypothetical protein